MNIRVDLNYPIKDGTEVVFRSPVDCSQVTGLKVYYPGASQEFVLADAHGNNVGLIDHLFAENVVVKVILDVTTSMAFVQNADTNAYLEGRFAELAAAGGGGAASGVVLYTKQNLINEQKAQARENIGAADADIFTQEATWTENGYISSSGAFASHNDYIATDFVPLVNCGIAQSVYYRVKSPGNLYIGLYNTNKEFIATIRFSDDTDIHIFEGTLNQEQANGAHYARFATLKQYTDKKVTFGRLTIGESSIVTELLANKAVTIDKIGFVAHLQGTNFIDKASLLINAYVAEGGAIGMYTGYRLTDYIKLEENTNYYFYNVYQGLYAFYDAEYNLILANGGAKTLQNPFQIPTGAVYGRFTMISPEKADTAWIHTKNEEPPAYGVAFDGIGFNPVKVNPTEYDGDDICVFTKGICIGDSLTQGTMNYYEDGSIAHYVNVEKYSYPTILSRLTGIEITNKGRSGATSAAWYQAEATSDLSGHDFAIIQLGVNDTYKSGGFTEESSTAFSNIINKLKAENKNIKIFVATIMPAISYNGADIDATSQGIRDFVNSLADPDVVLLDMAVYGHTKDSTAFNCGHLSAYGYWRLAKDYKAYISWYMSKNRDSFREVQFIGTDYVYEA